MERGLECFALKVQIDHQSWFTYLYDTKISELFIFYALCSMQSKSYSVKYIMILISLGYFKWSFNVFNGTVHAMIYMLESMIRDIKIFSLRVPFDETV